MGLRSSEEIKPRHVAIDENKNDSSEAVVETEKRRKNREEKEVIFNGEKECSDTKEEAKFGE